MVRAEPGQWHWEKSGRLVAAENAWVFRRAHSKRHCPATGGGGRRFCLKSKGGGGMNNPSEFRAGNDADPNGDGRIAMTALQTNGGTGKKTLRGGGSIEIERLPHGELYLNRAGGKAGLVSQFVRAGDHYRADYRPETLLAAKGIRVTKLSIPGLGTCALKEMSTAETPGWRKKLSMWIGIAFRRKYRRTFRVALAARSAGVDAYEPHAYWHDRRNGGRQYFLCEFVDGNSFEDLARRMAYPDEDREAVLAGFRTLGNMAARLNDHGIVNSDMLPQNVILSEDGKGGTRPRLIDLDLACFAPKWGRRMAFVHRMRAFRAS